MVFRQCKNRERRRTWDERNVGNRDRMGTENLRKAEDATMNYEGEMSGEGKVSEAKTVGFKNVDTCEVAGVDGERLKKQLDFVLEIDKEKNILRQTHITDMARRENDSEHAWHMAIMAYLLKEYANEKVDIGRVMIMCLIHDIVEIDAGDTYAYDAEGLKSQKEREEKAKERIFGMLPEEQGIELKGIFEEFEANKTAEARFAHAMDNVQPLLLNNYNDGEDWVAHGVRAEQVYGRHKKTSLGSEKLYDLSDRILKTNIELGRIRED